MSATSENIMDTRSDIDIQISDMNSSLDDSYKTRKTIIEKITPSLSKMSELADGMKDNVRKFKYE